MSTARRPAKHLSARLYAFGLVLAVAVGPFCSVARAEVKSGSPAPVEVARAASQGVARDAARSVPTTPTILSPANGTKTRYYYTSVKVGMSTDTTSVSILRGGVTVATQVVSDDTSVTFSRILLKLGYNTIVAVAANASGQTTSPAVSIKVVGVIGRPALLSVFPGRVFYGPRPNVTARTGANTTRIKFFVNSRRIKSLSIGSNRTFTLSRVPLRYGMNRVTLYAFNEFYFKRFDAGVWRLDISPRFDSLVLVDKSEFRIYLIKRKKLVVRYPCAIGKPSTPTPEQVWRIDSKEYPDPSSAYGPRKMRLFARHRSGSGYSYEYTNYAIHGTDTPSSIGHMASHGCIRMYNRNILKLFPLVPLHTMVVTRR